MQLTIQSNRFPRERHLGIAARATGEIAFLKGSYAPRLQHADGLAKNGQRIWCMHQDEASDDRIVWAQGRVIVDVHLLEHHVIMPCRAHPATRNFQGYGVEVEAMQHSVRPT